MQSHFHYLSNAKDAMLHALNGMRNKRVLIVGDSMIDHYQHGVVHRISPEAPVPVVLLQHEEYRLGGAANVAMNVQALGAETRLLSVIGEDQAGDIFLDRLQRFMSDVTSIVRSSTRPTTKKTRVISNGQQMLRIDHETNAALDAQLQERVLQQAANTFLHFKPELLIFEDYDKGMLSAPLIEQLTQMAFKHDCKVAVDPKYQSFMAYKHVHLLKPNLKELRDIVPYAVAATPHDLQKACNYVRAHMHQHTTLVTLGALGVYVEMAGKGTLYPTLPCPVADVSGAGDTVMAIAALTLVQEGSEEVMAGLSNLAGGQVIRKLGVVPIDLAALRTEICGLTAAQD